MTTGDGPEWAILQQVIQTLLKDQSSWLTTQDGSGWARPAFTPALLSKHKTHWKTTGMFIFLHLLTLGNGPEPIPPFLVYLLLTTASPNGHQSPSSQDALMSLELLSQPDSGTAELLCTWMVLSETDVRLC